VTSGGITTTAINTAISRGRTEIVKMLIEAGVDVTSGGITTTAINTAISRGRTEIVKMLIEAGVDVASGDITTTAINTAIRSGRTEMVKMLIEAGVDVASGGSTSPINTAIMWGRTEIVKMLIEAGCNLMSLDDRALESLDTNRMFYRHPVIMSAIEREKRWRHHKPFVTFVEWLNRLEDPPALPVVAALLSGGPITRQIAKFI
jgi:ankyrin repeat protein